VPAIIENTRGGHADSQNWLNVFGMAKCCFSLLGEKNPFARSFIVVLVSGEVIVVSFIFF
jgi:hypothetical protein